MWHVFFAVQFFLYLGAKHLLFFVYWLPKSFFFSLIFLQHKRLIILFFFRFLFLLFTHCLFFFCLHSTFDDDFSLVQFRFVWNNLCKKKIVRFYRFGSILSFGLSHTYIHALLFHLFNVNLLSHTPTYTVYNWRQFESN